MSRDRRTTRAAFALPDLLGLLAALAVAASLALAAARQMRQESMNASSLSQLRWLAGATSAYAADNHDLFWTFPWKRGATGSTYPDLQHATSDREAGAFQAVDILRRRAIPEMPTVAAWVPHILYNHLPLLDYLDTALPDFNLIAPHDEHRLAWARDPDAFAAGEFLPFQPEPTVANQRWIYSSGYELPPAFFSRAGTRPNPLSGHLFSIDSEAELGAWAVSEVAFPANKSHVFDRAGHAPGGGRQFALLPSSRVPMLTADGAANIITTAETNLGWHPRVPSSTACVRFSYEPYPWEPGPAAEVVTGHYRWTRGGIAGRDFGGPEIDTGQF